ncbi:hypothetical protein BSPA111_05200 [Buttiauxella sp. A111]|nr:hypothetical protein BSPA111_05200 [Buttiauxella sp. A111]
MKHMTFRVMLVLALISFQAKAAEPAEHSPSLNFPTLHKPSLHGGIQQRWPEAPQADINHQHWDAQHLDAARQTQHAVD